MKKWILPMMLAVPLVALADPVPTGTQSFADLGVPLANGSPTGNILTASLFTIGDLVSTKAQSGVFAGLPLQDFGSITFNVNKPTSFDFSDGAWGSFQSTLIDPTITTSHAGTTIAFFLVGNWTPGTFEKGAGTGPFPSDLTISFTQTPGGSGSISDSASFSTPALKASVPEPGTLGLLLASLGGLGVALWRRRK
jgi:hypothetical protein